VGVLMPKYVFLCKSCENRYEKYQSASLKTSICPTCNKEVVRSLPVLNGQADVMESMDKYTGVVVRQDQQEQIQLRKEEYYWSVEVPRFVNSGTYTLETMLENDWVYLDEKDNICINNKPPSKR
jgi:putative FmdB family regulatory protein